VTVVNNTPDRSKHNLIAATSDHNDAVQIY